jgi:hypothetical protein
MGEPDDGAHIEADYDPYSWKVILGFGLTVIAIPVLFVATCVPLGAALMASSNLFVPGVVAYTALFLAAAIAVGVRARNPGVQWAIAVIVIASVLILAAWFGLRARLF